MILIFPFLLQLTCVPRSQWGLDYRVLCPWQIYTPSTQSLLVRHLHVFLWSARPMVRRDYTYSPWSYWITSTACPVWLYSKLIGLPYCPWKVASEDPPFSYSVFFKASQRTLLFIPLNIKVIWHSKIYQEGFFKDFTPRGESCRLYMRMNMNKIQI